MKDTAKKLIELAKKATPGPWEYETEFGAYTITSVQDASKYIADVHQWTTPNSDNETKANAHFIASANPASITRLLERLLKLEDVLRDLDRNYDHHPQAQKLLTRELAELDRDTKRDGAE